MKKIFAAFLFVLMFASSNIVFSQCTPTLTGPGYELQPDTIVNLVSGMVNHPYTEVIQLFVPADTFGYTIVNAKLDSVIGVPAGFTYLTNPANGLIAGGTAGCISILGNAPTAAMEGEYPISVKITANVIFMGAPVAMSNTFTGYKLRILADTTTSMSVNEIEKSGFGIKQNFPNPFSDFTEIEYYNAKSGSVNLKVMGLTGNTILEETYSSVQGWNKIKVSSAQLSKGVFIYYLTGNNKTSYGKMAVNE